MSAMSQIIGHLGEIIATGHADPIVLLPVNIQVRGYVHVIGDNEAKRVNIPRLDVGGMLVSHLVHVLRADLVAKRFSDYAKVTEMSVLGKSFRVKQFIDDPAVAAEVDFYCTLVSS